jgi:hypothetical protein
LASPLVPSPLSPILPETNFSHPSAHTNSSQFSSSPFQFAQNNPPFRLYLSPSHITYLQELYPASAPSPRTTPLSSSIPFQHPNSASPVKRRRLNTRSRY